MKAGFDIFRKLDRADTHLRNLSRQFKRFEARHAARVAPRVVSAQKAPNQWSYQLEVDELVFPVTGQNWAPIIGDTVHNLHAALDYLIWALYKASGVSGGESRIAFPIFVDEKRYHEQSGRMLRGLSEDARDKIYQLQPFMSSNDPSDHPLNLLYQLERRDKHRSLNSTVMVGALHVESDPQVLPPFETTDIAREGTTLSALVRFTALRELQEVKFFVRPKFRLIFDEEGPLQNRDALRTLTEIRDHVRRKVLEPMMPFLPGEIAGATLGPRS